MARQSAAGSSYSPPSAPLAQLWAPGAAAEQGSETGAAPASEVETITVTARRREEDSQDVPIPIATVSGEALDKAGQFRFEDLNQHFPSTNIQFANPRQTSIAVRGLGNNPANDALESSVGVYLDDVYLGRPGMANQDLIDIAQISLLRGPQGTLFGKNTTGGVLNIASREPTFTPEARLESSVGQYGDNDYYQLRGAVSGPLVEDQLAGRLSFAKTFRDGFVDDVTDGRVLNGTERKGTRGDLLYTPTESLKIRLIGDYSTEDADCCASVLYSPGPNGGALYFSKVAAAGGNVVLDSDYDKVTLNTKQHMKVRQGGGSAKVDWDIGDYTVTSITAYRGWNFWPTNDGDGTSISAIINVGQHVDDSQWSQELRLASSSGGAIDWVTGLYYFYQDQKNKSYAYYGPDAGAFLGQAFLTNGTVISYQDLNTDSYSGFAQATWHATDRLDLTAGIRQTYERKTASVVRDQASGNPAIGAVFPAYETGNLDVSDTRPSGLVSVSYQFTDNVLAYTSVSSGAKAGGINPQVPARGLGLDSLFIEPEKAKDAELGVKTTLFDRRVQLNANAFQRIGDRVPDATQHQNESDQRQRQAELGRIERRQIHRERQTGAGDRNPDRSKRGKAPAGQCAASSSGHPGCPARDCAGQPSAPIPLRKPSSRFSGRRDGRGFETFLTTCLRRTDLFLARHAAPAVDAHRRDAVERHPPHHAMLIAVVVDRIVLRRAVVPDRDVAGRPTPPHRVFRRDHVALQQREQMCRIGARQPDDPLHEVAQQQRALAGFRMDVHDRMLGLVQRRRERVAEALRFFLRCRRTSRGIVVLVRMHGPQPIREVAQFRRQVAIGRHGVGPQRIAAGRSARPPRAGSTRRISVDERHVGMPGIRAPATRRIDLEQIGRTVLHRHRRMRDRLAQQIREGFLSGIVQMLLAAEEDHLVIVQRLANRRDLFLVDVAREMHPAYLRADAPGNGVHRHLCCCFLSHRLTPNVFVMSLRDATCAGVAVQVTEQELCQAEEVV